MAIVILCFASLGQVFALDNYSHSNCWLKYKSGYAGPFTGINPSTSEIFDAIRSLSVQYKVPIEIIGTVCYQESIGLYQYGADGFVVHNLTECKSFYNGAAGFPPGLGLMQLTGATAKGYDVNRLITDWRYNLETGVKVLRQKYDYALSLDPLSLRTIEIANWNVLENWRYALAFYNGYQTPAENPYVTTVCSIIALPPSRLSGLFTGVTLTRPQDVITGFTYGKGYAVKPDGSWLYYNGIMYYGTAHTGGGSVFEAYSGGRGTAGDPYKIATKADLLALRDNTGDYDKCFILTADIDLGGRVFTTAIIASFAGTFDGNGHKITGFTINGGSNSYLGLFGVINSGGSIKKLGLENFTVSGSGDVGGLVGWNSGGSISNCYSTGTVSGSNNVGGLVGENKSSIINCYSTGTVSGFSDSRSIGGLVGMNYGGSISNCYSTSTVSGSSDSYYVGGLVGVNYDTITTCYATGAVSGSYNVGGLVGGNEAWNGSGSVSNCYSKGTVSGSGDVGGLVGWFLSGSISNCYSTSTVSGSSGSNFVGGLVGYMGGGSVSNCYSTGSVSGPYEVGGLVGESFGIISNCYSTGQVNCRPGIVGGLVGENYGSISNCYSTGAVSGAGSPGGLVGYNKGSVSNCYSTGHVSGSWTVGGLIGENNGGSVSGSFWDIQTSGQTIGIGYGSSAGISGKTTAQMKTLSTFTSARWDFVRVWGINSGQYPYLRRPAKITARVFCPVELMVYDSEGRGTGLKGGQVITEIPDSVYDNNSVTLLFPSDANSYRYEVTGTGEGIYHLQISDQSEGQETTVDAWDIPIIAGAVNLYEVNWNILSQGQEGVTVSIDQDGDGTPERTITTTGQITGEDLNAQPVAEAGADQTGYAWIDGKAEVNLDGSGSYDDDNQSLTYLWTWTIDGNDYEADGVNPTIELPVGQHVISLIVNDGMVDSAADDVNVTVIAPVKGNLCVMPSTINRRSNEPWVLATIRLPDGIGQKDIDMREPLTLYPGGIKAKGRWILPCNERGHRFVNVFAFFDKDDLMAAVPQNGITSLKVSGKLKSGQYFYGCDTVKIIDLKLKWPWCQW